MVDIFKALGVEAVDSVGVPFDPNVHEAVLSEPSSEVPDQTVMEEFRKGFMLADKLLRPAMVKVSMPVMGRFAHPYGEKKTHFCEVAAVRETAQGVARAKAARSTSEHRIGLFEL